MSVLQQVWRAQLQVGRTAEQDCVRYGSWMCGQFGLRESCCSRCAISRLVLVMSLLLQPLSVQLGSVHTQHPYLSWVAFCQAGFSAYPGPILVMGSFLLSWVRCIPRTTLVMGVHDGKWVHKQDHDSLAYMCLHSKHVMDLSRQV